MGWEVGGNILIALGNEAVFSKCRFIILFLFDIEKSAAWAADFLLLKRFFLAGKVSISRNLISWIKNNLFKL